MKIIEQSTGPWQLQRECSDANGAGCGAKVAIDMDDLRPKWSTFYENCPVLSNFYAECTSCKAHINVDKDAVPKPYWDLIKSKPGVG